MKRIFLLISAMLAVYASASDRFYIEDFTMAAGETHEVSIVLENAVAYTAFQTDLYLSAGLSMEQEDGAYIFDLTSRKGRDHNIASQVQPNGAIRIMSYSPSIKAFSGSSGALVTFNVTASDNFAGMATIALRGTLFTTTMGMEIAFSDENCTVTTASLKGDVDGDNEVSITDVSALIDYLLNVESIGFNLANADVNDDGKIAIDDVTDLIDMLLYGN